MTTLIFFLMTGHVLLLLGFLWASLAASWRHFAGSARRPNGALPMTLIKPIRGADEGLEPNLRSVLDSDPRKTLQLIIAIESPSDPAYPIASALARANPDRDILVVLTGPSGERMGKIHNMIEALPKAKHPYVVFSDADIFTTPGMVSETAGAFQAGCEAVYGLPYHASSPGLGGWGFMVAFNHCFCVPAALSYRLGDFRFAAGAWMGYSASVLERMGGLEQFSRNVADDFAISDKARRMGVRRYLLREPVRVSESGQTLPETFLHLVKWASIIRWSLPGVYLLMPLGNLGVAAAALFIFCRWTGLHPVMGKGLLAAAVGSRMLVGYIQDRTVGRMRMAWWGYGLLAFVDLGSLLFWVFGLRSRISWRGKTYRLSPGGEVTVLTDSARPA